MNRIIAQAFGVTAETELIPVATLERRAAAAVRLATQGERYGDADRAEMVGDLITAVMAEAATYYRPRHGSAREVLAWIDYAERHAAGLIGRLDVIPAETCTFSKLYGMAANGRRSIDRRTERERKADAERARLEATPSMALRPEHGLSAESAHRAALEMVDALGVLGDYRAYVLAYASARRYAEAVDGGILERDAELRDALAELELPADFLKNAMRPARLPKWLPSYAARSARDHLATLGAMEDTSTERKSSVKLGDGTRSDLPKHEHAPIAPSTSIPLAPRPHGHPDWAREMMRTRPASAERMAHAAHLRAERMARKEVS
jgi:hypothetical protein